jgi:HD-GYP domain-containing protein (c-di-GMP phosphodiesterase class II)
MLRCVGVDDDEWISCVLMHHENDEGSGYPAGIASPK